MRCLELRSSVCHLTLLRLNHLFKHVSRTTHRILQGITEFRWAFNADRIYICACDLDKRIWSGRKRQIIKFKVEFIITVTITEFKIDFKTDFDKYLDLLTKEDIFITHDGKTIATVINPQISAVDSIQGY